MLHALRESRDALEWRVTQTKAALIVLRSGGEAELGENQPLSHAVVAEEAVPAA